MAEEPQVIRGINWREVFPFTHVFRAFRIAIHPSKLALAFMALFSLYMGGRILDGVWMDKYRAVPKEIEAFQIAPNLTVFQKELEGQRKNLIDSYANYLRPLNKTELNDQTKLDEAARGHEYLKEVLAGIEKQGQDALDAADAALKQVMDAKPTDAAKKAAEDAHEQAIRAAYAAASGKFREIEASKGRGLFQAFMEYQTQQINAVWRGVLGGNWLGGLGDQRRDEAALNAMLGAAGAPTGNGVLISAFHFFTVAPAWALTNHWFYFILYGALFLVVWSLFGGAIARIAAVHVADEGRKLSVRQGLGFAVSKFLSFVSAPMIPLIIVGGIGLAMAVVAGLVGWIPALGEIVIGALFILALAGGAVMALVLLGMIGGFNLMYPTIAVEGSDSFDAISRSFSYVYAKPWRMLLYTLVAIAYGSLCYVFARLFVWLVLVLTQFFVGLLIFRHANDGGALWPAIFPPPSWDKLPFNVNTYTLSWAGRAAGFFVSIWSYILISLLGSLAISLYFSANTIIYYLMRKEVDATEMDDVYLEQPEEEFAETPKTEAAGTTQPATQPSTSAPTTQPTITPPDEVPPIPPVEPTPPPANPDTPPSA